MSEQDASELKNTLKTRQSVPTSFKKENSNMHIEDTELKMLNHLYDCLVSKYEKLKIKLTETGKNLKISTTENTRFKLAMRCLMKNVAQLTGCREDGCLENDCFENDAFYLQECGDKLIRELCEGVKKVESLEELIAAEELRAAASRGSTRDLQECADVLTATERPRDRVADDWRAVYERLSVEIADSASAKKQLLEAVGAAEADAADGAGRTAADGGDELRAEVDALKAGLADEAAEERALCERIVRSEGSGRPDVDRRDRGRDRSAAERRPESGDDGFDSCSSTADDST